MVFRWAAAAAVVVAFGFAAFALVPLTMAGPPPLWAYVPAGLVALLGLVLAAVILRGRRQSWR